MRSVLLLALCLAVAAVPGTAAAEAVHGPVLVVAEDIVVPCTGDDCEICVPFTGPCVKLV